jgi:hypothetical protein
MECFFLEVTECEEFYGALQTKFEFALSSIPA